MNGCSSQQVLWQNLENGFCERFHFKANRKSIDFFKKGTRDFQNSPPLKRSAYFYVTISGNFE